MANLAAVDPLLIAQECLDALELDQTHPIDVLEALSRLGLTTTVVNLGDVLGVVVPQGGVMLSSQRGETVQRYTAAHEIGHWLMHRDSLLVDTQQDILGEPVNLRERQAQLFASYFLMPPPLLMDALGRRGITPHQVEAGQVYMLARDLRVSYEAALVRLRSENYLSQAKATALRTLGRARARAEAFGGRRPADGHADMWSAGMHDTTHLDVTVGDEILVQLPENRTTPYRWHTPGDVAQPMPRAAQRPAPPAPDLSAGGNEGTQDVPRGVETTAAARKAALALVPDVGAASAATTGEHNAISGGALVLAADQYRLADAATPADVYARRRALGTERGDELVAARTPTATAALGQRLLQVQCLEEGEYTLQLRYADAFNSESPVAATWDLTIEIGPTLTTRQRRRLLAVDLDVRMPDDPDDEALFG